MTDAEETGADTSIRAGIGDVAVAAGLRAACVQAVAVGLSFATFLSSRPFDRPAQGPTASMLFTAIAYCGTSWLALTATGHRAFARRPVPAGLGSHGPVRLAASPETIAAWTGILAAVAYATAALVAAGASGVATLALDEEPAVFLGTVVFVTWAGQCAVAALAAVRQSGRRQT